MVTNREAGIETRNRILEVSFRLFHEQGYHATAIATILREADVNSGSLYHYFPSKEALLVGVLRWALTELHPQVIGPAEERTQDPIGRVFALLANYRMGMDMMGCRMGCPIGNLALEVADDHDEARRLIHENFENWCGAVRAWLDSAADLLPEGTDRAVLSRFILTVMEGGLMQARAAKVLKPFDESVAVLREHFDMLLERGRDEKLRRGVDAARTTEHGDTR